VAGASPSHPDPLGDLCPSVWPRLAFAGRPAGFRRIRISAGSGSPWFPSGSRSAGLPGFPGAPALPFLLTGRGCARTYYPASARWRRLVQQSVSERFPDWGKSDKTCFITNSWYFSTAGLSGRIPAPLAVLRAPATPPPRRTAGRAPSPERGSNARSPPGRANRVADRPSPPRGPRSWPAARP